MNPMKILLLSAEIAPFAKTGGLADVCGSLPKALRALGHDVRLMMPAYASIEVSVAIPDTDMLTLPPYEIPMGFGSLQAGAFQTVLPGSDIPVYFIAQGGLFNRAQIYGYGDDPYRFAFFSRAALELTRQLGWKPDVVHANDWHTAPAVTWLATNGATQDEFRWTASLFTIHNLAHQGHSDWGVFDFLGIATHSLNEEGYNEINWMARGIFHATLINTVSPNYSREILTPDGGSGMDGILRSRQYDVHGILNGLDFDEWNPSQDSFLVRNYDVNTLEKRIENKRALQERAGFKRQDDIPLVAMVTRLDWQKGLDITGHVVHLLMNNFAGEAQFIVLGTGNYQYLEMFSRLADYHRGKMAAFLFYDAGLSHQIYAGSDLFLMPSLFEPCGLGQMIAMRYGSIPVVRSTGGLADTIQDGVTGFTFHDFNSEAFWQTLQRALYIYRVDHESWQTIQKNGMQADHSWSRSAFGYQQLYEWALARTRWNFQVK